jgi:hypothetical protein
MYTDTEQGSEDIAQASTQSKVPNANRGSIDDDWVRERDKRGADIINTLMR